MIFFFFFFSSRRRHTRLVSDWSSDVCSSDLHVALVLNEDGARLAKRDGAVTLAEIGVQRAFAQIAESLGLHASNLDEMLAQFDPDRLPQHPWIYLPD